MKIGTEGEKMKSARKKVYFFFKIILLLLISSIIICYSSMIVYFVLQWNIFFFPHQTVLVEIIESEGPHYFGDKAACYIFRAGKNIWSKSQWDIVDRDVVEQIDKYFKVYGMTVYDTIPKAEEYSFMKYLYYEKRDNKLWLVYDFDGGILYAYEYIG